MKNYEGANIRNVAVVGHSHSGKTSLVSAMLYTAGSTQRLGRVDEGNTVTDYDEEEIARQMTISAAMSFVEWGKTKINLIDTPGFNMFTHEAEMVLPAVEAALVVVDAVSGVQVVTQKIWGFAEKYSLPRILVCTRMDRERADFQRCMESLTTTFGRTVIPVQLPIGSEKSFSRRNRPGAHESLHLRGRRQWQGQGRAKFPRTWPAEAAEAHERLVELVAEGDDALMEEFFSSGTLPEERLAAGIHNAVRNHKVFPVLFASGLGQCWHRRPARFHGQLRAHAGGTRNRAGRGRIGKRRACASARLPTASRFRSTSSRP